jgi:hypothetical protein
LGIDIIVVSKSGLYRAILKRLDLFVSQAQASLDSTAVAEWSLVDEHDEEVVPYVSDAVPLLV